MMLFCAIAYCMDTATHIQDGWSLCDVHTVLFWDAMDQRGRPPCAEEDSDFNGMPLWMVWTWHLEEHCACYAGA